MARGEKGEAGAQQRRTVARPSAKRAALPNGRAPASQAGDEGSIPSAATREEGKREEGKGERAKGKGQAGLRRTRQGTALMRRKEGEAEAGPSGAATRPSAKKARLDQRRDRRHDTAEMEVRFLQRAPEGREKGQGQRDKEGRGRTTEGERLPMGPRALEELTSPGRRRASPSASDRWGAFRGRILTKACQNGDVAQGQSAGRKAGDAGFDARHPDRG